ncbi:MAG: hypothetical protein KBT68_02560 [bacterium]|nr:hypothetical protein [Candidatus Colisoma equi]
MAGKKVRDSIYQLFDNFTLFCLRYANENAGEDPRFWMTSVGSPLESTWAGLSFELVCLEHVEQIKRAAFRRETGTRKAVHVTYVTTSVSSATPMRTRSSPK